MSEAAVYVPRIAAALLVLIVGAWIARMLRGVVVRLFETFRVSSVLKKTPVEHFLQNAELGNKIEDVLGSIFYWVVMLVVIHTTVSILGLASLSLLLERVLNYLPKIISAVIVLFFGVLLAGLVENLVKGSIKSIDMHSSILLGKISSYLVVSITVLAAISELGIAREFILILFVGFVVMLALGGGLALGLGSKDLVSDVLKQWYKRLQRDVSKK